MLLLVLKKCFFFQKNKLWKPVLVYNEYKTISFLFSVELCKFYNFQSKVKFVVFYNNPFLAVNE